MSDDDIEKELTSRDHDEVARSALLCEAVRRLARAKSRPNWLQWMTLGVALVAAIFSAIAAMPVLTDLGEHSWLDF
jgi:hypothetical protein